MNKKRKDVAMVLIFILHRLGSTRRGEYFNTKIFN